MDQLKLSKGLIENIKKILVEADERAENPLLASQYLAAITGFLVGNHNLPTGEKNEIMNELVAFTKYVYEDVSGQRQDAIRPKGEAFGIWKPGDP
ncbi:MAG: hypothetical protein OXC41_02785 [Gammaproteobacteria bacterium]|nr:hypothetical protein [Gammaproteobacteria bacterium]